MVSTIFRRRALLAGTVSLGSSALLVVCGQQASNEVSASSTDATSTEPSEVAPRLPLEGLQTGAICFPAC